ncbi:uncharacterized protein [Physcomitrium patens]|uniref:Glutaredoxin domain-containing protein n=1 Tax=Physcomitrium patens TaxID=3218 RepID=A0A2K1KSZ4_PHYPA|nr:monothiol glutaredoxin-S15, mitochondrial-like [Physcomitrium patens]XP_024371466.1 monothiol glutaredoxin-S15, mitochondrial-like [Physcomitrium patens]XP_024371467.1 monothiol glutaredoxin-S15, mitochondrial-like [Physcomitrium patens]PNR56914.1 hypothetical protein PHYPA_003906 [Physcomitrium patens]|eukprot:XP_024371465.1 monothiol glutaredoxin-S15, mitochondrial-like [Physcomitrella patens]
MLGTRARGLSRLLLRAVASAPPQPQGGQFRILPVVASTASSPSRFSFGRDNAPWVLQRAGVTIPAGDEPDTHDDFKPVQKQADSLSPVHEAIEKDVKENQVMVFMKGVPQAPQCGFSAMVVRILDEYGVGYKSRNVLADPELRTAIKDYSKWPTIPQVYVNGEFVGGSDILISMHRSGELKTLFKDVKKEEF